VLFCDLVGSTGIASHLDPEEWQEIVREYQIPKKSRQEHLDTSALQVVALATPVVLPRRRRFSYPTA
jgi:hypothetical protein